MTVIPQVKKILADLSGIADFADDASIADTLELDSLDRLSAAIAFEETFGIEIPDADADRPELGTPAGIAEYIEGRLGNGEPVAEAVPAKAIEAKEAGG